MSTDKEKMIQARSLIERKQYAEARRLLQQVNHPTAKAWLAKLDAREARRKATVKASRSTGRMGGLKTRMWIFRILALLALSWIVLGFIVTGNAANETAQATNPQGDVEKAGTVLGLAICSSGSIAVFLCTGLPFLLTFALLAWRNGAGLRIEQRHLETLSSQ